jgi:hypothetical protein
MLGNRTSRAKLARSNRRPGVIQLSPPAHPATVGGEKSCCPNALVSELKSGTPGTLLRPSFRYMLTASSTGLVIRVPTEAGL